MKQSKLESEQQQIEKLLSSQIQIPPRPVILLEIDRLLHKPNNQLEEIAQLINQDVGLSAAIFKLVNSSFYKMPAPIENISKAITILGLSQVSNLIKGLSLRKAIGGQEIAFEKFWERSDEIALLCAIIAKKQIAACNIAVDQAFMAGLFHECGVPILMQRFPEYCQTFRINHGSHWPDFREEDVHFKTDHAVVGFMVTRHWNLPEFICQAVRYHHDRLNVDYAALTMVSILQLARHLHLTTHRLIDPDWPKMKNFVLEEIGVGFEESNEFMEDVLEKFHHQRM
jgi:HD-like signal output (HDOD) protein